MSLHYFLIRVKEEYPTAKVYVKLISLDEDRTCSRMGVSIELPPQSPPRSEVVVFCRELRDELFMAKGEVVPFSVLQHHDDC